MAEEVGEKKSCAKKKKNKKGMGEWSKVKSLEIEEDLDRLTTIQKEKVCSRVSLIEINIILYIKLEMQMDIFCLLEICLKWHFKT